MILGGLHIPRRLSTKRPVSGKETSNTRSSNKRPSNKVDSRI